MSERLKPLAGAMWFVLLAVVFVLQFNPAPLFYKGSWTGFSDEDAYLAHALTIGLDFDLDYSNEPIRALNPRHTGPLHPVGPGIMAAPFVALFSLVDRWQGHPVITNHRAFLTSWSLFGFLFSKVVYFFASLSLYFDGAKRIRKGLISRGMTLLLIGGSGVLFYVLARFSMGHSFEVFTHALVFWGSTLAWQRLQEAPTDSTLRRFLLPALFAEAGVVLNILIRPSNLNLILLPHLIVGLLVLGAGRPAIRPGRVHAILLAALALCLIPAELLLFHFYGKPFPSIYDQYGLRVPALQLTGGAVAGITRILGLLLARSASLPHVLFSAEFGVLYSSPLMLIGTAALLGWLGRQIRSQPGLPLAVLVVGVIVYVGSSVAVVILWQTPGMDFGYRYLYSLLPLSFLGYLLWSKDEMDARVARRRALQITQLATATLCLFSMTGQILYGATPALEMSDHSLSLGFIEGPTAKHYESHVLRAIGTSEAWKGVLLERLPAYIAIKSWPVSSSSIFAVAARLSVTRAAVMRVIEVMNRTTDSAPPRVSVQILVLGLFWLLASMQFTLRGVLTSSSDGSLSAQRLQAALPICMLFGTAFVLWSHARNLASAAGEVVSGAQEVATARLRSDPVTLRFVDAVSRRVGTRKLIYGRADVLMGFEGLSSVRLAYPGSPLTGVTPVDFDSMASESPGRMQQAVNAADLGYVLINTAQPRLSVLTRCAEPSPLMRSEVIRSGGVSYAYELYAIERCHQPPSSRVSSSNATPGDSSVRQDLARQRLDPALRTFADRVRAAVKDHGFIYGRPDLLADFGEVLPSEIRYRGAPQGRGLSAANSDVLEHGSPASIQRVLSISRITYVMISTAQPRPLVFDDCAKPSPLVRSTEYRSGLARFTYELYALGRCHEHVEQTVAADASAAAREARLNSPMGRFSDQVNAHVRRGQGIYGRPDLLRDFEGLASVKLIYRGRPGSPVTEQDLDRLESGSAAAIQHIITSAGIGYIMINTAEPRPRALDLCAEPAPLVTSEDLISGGIRFTYQLYALGPCHPTDTPSATSPAPQANPTPLVETDPPPPG